jgi:transposase-like protein
MAAQDGAGERRRTRSLDERKRIVEEALAPGVSVAAVARRHGLSANLVFKWIRRSREGGSIGGARLRRTSLSWPLHRRGADRPLSREAA